MMSRAIIQCTLCKKLCQIYEGQRGDCRVRINLGGKLQTLVYGKPCAVHIDPIEKKPLFHVLPSSTAFSIATAGCNLHCKYCQNWEISQVEPERARNIDMSPQEVLAGALKYGSRSIAYTYSEPTVFFEYMVDTARLAKANNILNLWITAGFINPEPLEELCTVIDAANVDLKGITEDFYKNVCGGELAPVQETLKTLKAKGVWQELTNLIVPTLNDDTKDIEKLIDWCLENLGADVPLHFSRFWPMHKLKNLPPTPVETLTKAYEIAISKGLHYVYVGNVPGHKGNNTYCPVCKRLLIKRVGYSIFENNVVQGKCKFCDNVIPGIWS